MFSTKAAPGDVAKYAADGVRPLTLVMRVNDEADTCEGLLLGFAWERTGPTGKLWNVAEVAKLGLRRQGPEALLGTRKPGTIFLPHRIEPIPR